jgi:hypothetical protein
MDLTKQVKPQNVQVFEKRFDFYWKSIAIYSIVLIVYSLLRGTIEQGTLTMAISDPLVILLAFIIIASILGYLTSIWKSPKIIISKDSITFKTKILERKYSVSEIVKITIGKETISNMRKSLRVVRIFIAGRRKPYKIRPSSFWNENELWNSLLNFKKSHNK